MRERNHDGDGGGGSKLDFYQSASPAQSQHLPGPGIFLVPTDVNVMQEEN